MSESEIRDLLKESADTLRSIYTHAMKGGRFDDRDVGSELMGAAHVLMDIQIPRALSDAPAIEPAPVNLARAPDHRMDWQAQETLRDALEKAESRRHEKRCPWERDDD